MSVTCKSSLDFLWANRFRWKIALTDAFGLSKDWSKQASLRIRKHARDTKCIVMRKNLLNFPAAAVTENFSPGPLGNTIPSSHSFVIPAIDIACSLNLRAWLIRKEMETSTFLKQNSSLVWRAGVWPIRFSLFGAWHGMSHLPKLFHGEEISRRGISSGKSVKWSNRQHKPSV